ncbi:hypothetical protein [Sphingomonas bacterium]|uniref:hypothetical protein n=1 Tax=Sphingomonas bacterium TaxID=1895847 RepID=UPI00263423B1|nr:hypothetical protein [Sphingomonas bacterium]
MATVPAARTASAPVVQCVLDEERAALADVHHTTQDPLLRNIVGEAIGLNGVDFQSGDDPEKAHAARVNQNDRTQHEVNLDPQQLTEPLTRQSHLLHELIHVSADRRYNANAGGDRDPALTAVVDPGQTIAEQDKEIGRQSKHRYGLAESLHDGVDDDDAVGDDIKALVKDRASRAMGHPHRELDSVSSELYYEFHRRGVDQTSHTFAKVKALAHGTYRSRNEGVPLDQVYEEPQRPGKCCVVQ